MKGKFVYLQYTTVTRDFNFYIVQQEVGLFAELSKVVVRSYKSAIVHVYSNAILYKINRPNFVTQMNSDVRWFTIRVRKSRYEKFRTLADMCGLQVELLLLTKETVKMVFDETYEYTLHFAEDDDAKLFVNSVYDVSKKASRLSALCH